MERQTEEFLFAKRYMIRESIDKRTTASLRKLGHGKKKSTSAFAQAAGSSSSAHCSGDVCNPILVSESSDCDDEDTFFASSSTTTAKHTAAKRQRARAHLQTTTDLPTAPSAKPFGTSTIERLITKLQSDEAPVVLDPPDCHNDNCPYCKGGLMRQRYILAQRLVQIEHSLYGEDSIIFLS